MVYASTPVHFTADSIVAADPSAAAVKPKVWCYDWTTFRLVLRGFVLGATYKLSLAGGCSLISTRSHVEKLKSISAAADKTKIKQEKCRHVCLLSIRSSSSWCKLIGRGRLCLSVCLSVCLSLPPLTPRLPVERGSGSTYNPKHISIAPTGWFALPNSSEPFPADASAPSVFLSSASSVRPLSDTSTPGR